MAFAIALTVFLPWIEGRGGLLGETDLSLLELTVDDGYEAMRPYRDLGLMVSGVVLVGLTCAGGVSGPGERRRAIGRGAAFALAAIPACDVVLGDLLFDEADAIIVHMGAYALLIVAATGIAVCCVSSCMAGRLPREELDDGGDGQTISALCWGGLITYLIMTGAFALQEVSALRLDGDARRDVYGHFGVVALSIVAAATMPYLAWVLSRFGNENTAHHRPVGRSDQSYVRMAADRVPAYPTQAPLDRFTDEVPTGVWRTQAIPRPYMYATYDGVTVWEDGRCAVPICQLPAHAPIVVTGEIGPFYRVRLAVGSHGVVEKRALRS